MRKERVNKDCFFMHTKYQPQAAKIIGYSCWAIAGQNMLISCGKKCRQFKDLNKVGQLTMRIVTSPPQPATPIKENNHE